jgi:hypothetical protein
MHSGVDGSLEAGILKILDGQFLDTEIGGVQPVMEKTRTDGSGSVMKL